MPMLSRNELLEIGFQQIGRNVAISNKVSFYNPQRISIGDNTRIDDYCVISAGNQGIEFGRNVHIAVYVSIIGRGKITISDFAGISARSAIYSSNDDYSGEFMTNPTLPSEYTNVKHADVRLGKHVVIGAGSIILPGVVIAEGAIVGALSLVKNDCESFGIYVGTPAKLVRPRSRKLLILEKQYMSSVGGDPDHE